MANLYGLKKQRVAQIVGRFINNINLESNFWLSLKDEIEETLMGKLIITNENLKSILHKKGIINVEGSVNQLLKINPLIPLKVIDYNFKDIDIPNESKEKFLIVCPEHHKEILKWLMELNRFPNANGIVKIIDFINKFKLSELEQEAFATIIKESPYLEVIHEEWYFNDMSNDSSLKNSLINIRKVTDVVSLSTLSQSLVNTYKGRSRDFSKPDITVITNYLKRTSHVNIIDEKQVELLVQQKKLDETEKKVIEVLSSKRKFTYEELKSRLGEKGISEYYVKKIMYWPIIQVTYGGFKKNTYSLIGRNDKDIDRKEFYQEKLIKLNSSTDIERLTKERLEQRIFREYLFGGRTHEQCAICRGEYPISYLVAAHKKKRSLCNEEERKDINIIMPLCVFGCDALYEHRDIYVDENGFIRGRLDCDVQLKGAVQSRTGMKIEDKWLESPGYFMLER